MAKKFKNKKKIEKYLNFSRGINSVVPFSGEQFSSVKKKSIRISEPSAISADTGGFLEKRKINQFG